MQHMTLRILTIVLLWAGFSFPAYPGDGISRDSDLGAAEILAAVEETYSVIDTYRDIGSVRGEWSLLGIDIDWLDDGIRFSTAFARPDRFRFEFEYQYPSSEEWHSYVVQADPSGVRTNWHANPGVEQEASLGLAVAGATGVSRGAAHSIPTLLLPQEIGGWRITNLESASKIENGNIDGRAYMRIRGEHPSGSPVVVWIDPDTFLIRRIEKRLTILLMFRVDWTTDFEAKVSTPIDPAELRL